MKEFYVVYDKNTGFEDGGHGICDKSLTPNGSTRIEWIAAALVKKPSRAVAYFSKDTTFDPEIQKIENDAIVEQTIQEISDKDKIKTALQRIGKRDVELFRMILTIWEIGIAKGLWANNDLAPEMKQMAQEWKQDLTDLGY